MFYIPSLVVIGCELDIDLSAGVGECTTRQHPSHKEMPLSKSGCLQLTRDTKRVSIIIRNGYTWVGGRLRTLCVFVFIFLVNSL